MRIGIGWCTSQEEFIGLSFTGYAAISECHGFLIYFGG